MATKKRVPEIRFQGFEGEWEEKKYATLFTVIPNNILSRAELNYSHGIAKNIHYGDVLIKFGELLDAQKESLPFISDANVVEKIRASKLQNGDVVIADAAEDEIVGKCTELTNVHDQVIFSGLHTIASRPITPFATGFLGYAINSSAYHDQLLSLMQGTKVLSISKSSLQDTTVRYPAELHEQSQIGSFFQNLDAQITLHQRKLSKLGAVKKSMLEKMFPREGAAVPEIRFQGFKGQWERKTLGEITSKIGDGLHGTPQYTDDGGVYFINGNNLFSGSINTDHETKQVIKNEQSIADKELDNTTILMSINGTIGNLALYQGENVMLGKSVAYLSIENHIRDFIYTYLQSPVLQNFFLRKLTGTTIKNLGLKIIRESELLIPEKGEQQKIASFFTHLDSLITLQQRELDKLKNIKQACLAKMFV